MRKLKKQKRSPRRTSTRYGIVNGGGGAYNLMHLKNLLLYVQSVLIKVELKGV